MPPQARSVILGACLWILFAGCEAPLPAAPPANTEVEAMPDDPFRAWKAILDTPAADRDVEQAIALTGQLAKTEAGLAPMVKLLADEAASADEKVFALICLTTQREALERHEARLLAGVDPELPPETRKFSAHALGLLNTRQAREAVKGLVADTDPSVREAAMGVLISFHPDLVSDRIEAFWANPETSVAARDQVLLGMPPHLVERFVRLYAEAVGDARLSVVARLKAVRVLGQVGGEEHIAVLEACMETDPDAAVREQARGAAAMLRTTSGTDTGGAQP